MTGELLINGKDAYTQWKINMGDDFLNNILTPAGMKEFVENQSRLNNGKEVLYTYPRIDARDVTLLFVIEGNTPDEHLRNLQSFSQELQKGKVEITIPPLGSEIYRLTYQRSQSFAQSSDRTLSKLTVKFNEPNPSNRK